MKIAWDDDIWGRLYGPYGNHSVSRQLLALSEHWDGTIAKDLFWEELHHQDEIYPATFAALPWLVEFSASADDAFTETYLFLSHVIHCACAAGATGCDGTAPQGKYRGLSTDIRDHQHAWIPSREWLSVEDQPVLVRLEDWFSENRLALAKRCLNLVGPDPVISAHAIEGFASVNGGSRVAASIQMFANGENIDDISWQLGAYDRQDAMTVETLFPYIQTRNPDLASFMLDYPGYGFVPEDPRQGSLL